MGIEMASIGNAAIDRACVLGEKHEDGDGKLGVWWRGLLKEGKRRSC